jgi:hypothetical protein
MEKVQREKREDEEGRRRACENNNTHFPAMSRTPRPPPQSMAYMETKLPAIQAEQVEDDVAPVAAEYVPAKARNEEHG